ncbi:MAG: toll/interleukin-1 receptor domain-containing protein [Anaerolineae bacterium]|nr:toll/interleukin-1 receptor domain-containing protein [Anaerolineae bacterium]
MSHVFISYSRRDKACAYKIQRQLEAQGFKIWIDKNDIPAGAAFPNSLLTAIREAAAVLVLWSQQAKESNFVEKEIKAAEEQRLMRDMPLVPVWLDNTPLPPELQTLNAVEVKGCTDDEIKKLVGRLQRLRFRKLLPFNPDVPLENQGAVPLRDVPALSALPIMESVYCKGQVIAPPNLSLTAVKAHRARTVQVFLEFVGMPGNYNSVAQIYQTLQTLQPQTPFFLFHFTGHESGTEFALTDDPEEAPHGDWLDPVGAVYETLQQMLGRGGASIQLFNAIPASLNFAIGMKFYNFWHLQLFHYTRSKRYQFVLDTNDL